MEEADGMKILIIGAGALGGYFGARLIDVGADVTFLLRPRRAEQIGQTGLVIDSPLGSTTIAQPKWVSREALDQVFDVIMVGCKAYDLADTMDAFAPAVGDNTMIVPLLNGMAHLDALIQRFGPSRVVGGSCFISAALNAQGVVQHFNLSHRLLFGELAGGMSARVEAFQAVFDGALCDARASDDMLGEMWGKWVQIATVAGMTCLMRGSIGDIVTSGGAPFASALLDEAVAVARLAGFSLSDATIARIRGVVTDAASPVTASMMKDLERGASIEAEQLVGDLIRRRDQALQASGETSSGLGLLDLVWLSLKTYQARQARS
jgi:2-dehydropantoate 2-reductase